MAIDIIGGPLLALLAGVGIGIAAGIAGGNMKLGVYWALVIFIFLTIETSHTFLTGVFVVVLIFVGVAVMAWVASYFFGGGED